MRAPAPAASAPEASLDRLQAAIEIREHIGNTQRLRVGVCAGTCLWLAFAMADWYTARIAYDVTVGPVWAARIANTPVLLCFLWRLFRGPPPSRRMLALLEGGVFTATAIALGWMSVHLGGLASPYTAALVLVLLCRGAFVVQPWRDALLVNAIICGAYFVVLIAGSFALSSHAVSRADWAVFGLNFAYVVTGAAFIVLSCHTAWTLRRRAFAQRRIGDYDLLYPLAQGGQADVWHAHQRATRRDVALKILTGPSNQTKTIRFMREFEFLSKLEHPNIVKVLDYGISDEQIWYYAMELLTGSTLAEIVQTQGPLEVSRAAALFAEVCSALSASHASGVVHRDVKPDNIFVVAQAGREQAKLLDYGISRLLQDTQPIQLTEAARIVGTPAFMPPELVMGRAPDGRSDVYSTAAAFWYAVTGRLPFEGESVEQTLKAQIDRDRTHLSTGIAGALGERVDVLMRACLSVDPNQRPGNADMLALALRGLCADQQPSKASAHTSPTTVEAAALPWQRGSSPALTS